MNNKSQFLPNAVLNPLFRKSHLQVLGVLFLLLAGTANAALFTETVDAGNSIETAVDVGPDIDAIRGTAGVSESDYFKVHFNQPVSFTAFNLIWDSPNNRLHHIRLWDVKGSMVTEYKNVFWIEGNQGTQFLAENLLAGTYFIQIYSGALGIGGYEFSFAPLTTIAPPPTPLPTPLPVPANSWLGLMALIALLALVGGVAINRYH